MYRHPEDHGDAPQAPDYIRASRPLDRPHTPSHASQTRRPTARAFPRPHGIVFSLLGQGGLRDAQRSSALERYRRGGLLDTGVVHAGRGRCRGSVTSARTSEGVGRIAWPRLRAPLEVVGARTSARWRGGRQQTPDPEYAVRVVSAVVCCVRVPRACGSGSPGRVLGGRRAPAPQSELSPNPIPAVVGARSKSARVAGDGTPRPSRRSRICLSDRDSAYRDGGGVRGDPAGQQRGRPSGQTENATAPARGAGLRRVGRVGVVDAAQRSSRWPTHRGAWPLLVGIASSRGRGGVGWSAACVIGAGLIMRRRGAQVGEETAGPRVGARMLVLTDGDGRGARALGSILRELGPERAGVLQSPHTVGLHGERTQEARDLWILANIPTGTLPPE
ncbi:hypothetical protein B0H10DRAFT_2190584 [Mycena sp. CBHHK59/15]|nr:hypothetical protein B0H10DRAFT_2190584 [Mycena sp. CBHHK59/15]